MKTLLILASLIIVCIGVAPIFKMGQEDAHAVQAAPTASDVLANAEPQPPLKLKVPSDTVRIGDTEAEVASKLGKPNKVYDRNQTGEQRKLYEHDGYNANIGFIDGHCVFALIFRSNGHKLSPRAILTQLAANGRNWRIQNHGRDIDDWIREDGKLVAAMDSHDAFVEISTWDMHAKIAAQYAKR